MTANLQGYSCWAHSKKASMTDTTQTANQTAEIPVVTHKESVREGGQEGWQEGGKEGREGCLSWDHYFMSVAFLSSQRSKDPSTQVGACIVDTDNRIVAVGYNGFPRGCADGALPWAREADTPLDTKYPYVVHAEANAILNRNAATLRGCRLYVALFPCNECTKLLLQSGIAEVIYFSDKYHDTVPMTASRRMLELAGITVRQFVPPADTLVLRFAL